MNSNLELFLIKNHLEYEILKDNNLKYSNKIFANCPTVFKPMSEMVKVKFENKTYNNKPITTWIVGVSMGEVYMYVETDKFYAVDIEEIK